MNISRMERMCAQAGLHPEMRGHADGLEFFIADGFSPAPWRDFQKFGATKAEFPHGAFASMWIVAEGVDRVVGGGLCMFDTFHDLSMMPETKKQMRINAAIKAAEQFLADRKSAKEKKRNGNAVSI